MKAIKFPKEHGQALVIIAFAAVALFAFAALAIDGGRVFSDRRHSQNASDTSVMAAALAKIRGESWQAAGLTRAAENDYDDADAETEVYIASCGGALPITSDGVQVECKGLPAGVDPNQYIVVHIKSVVHTTFARVIGRYTITNHTDAVARATEPEITNWYDGFGIASTHQGCWPNQNSVPFDLGGSSTTFVNGAGVLVSAVCPGDSSINVSGNPSLDTTTGVCAPGAVTLPANDQDNLGNPGLNTNCNVPPPDYYTLPAEPNCTTAGSITEVSNGNWEAQPGYFNNSFPDVQGGQANIKVRKGVYCLRDGIDLGAGWTITTDTNGNLVHDPATEGAFFYVSGGDVEFNGNAYAFLHAISDATNHPTWTPYLNYLIFVPPSNPANIHITGSSGSVFTGTILAPTSSVTLQGATDNLGGDVTLDAQIISDIVQITGNTDLTIVYNDANNSTTTTIPGIQLIE